MSSSGVLTVFRQALKVGSEFFLDFNKLNYLIAIAELQSFSKAAQKCFVSQPALTRCVKNIEEELGVKLFDRTCSPIKLTYAGEHYISAMREILQLKVKLDQEMEDIAARKRNRLALGIPSTRSATWLPRILPAFNRECPNVDIQLIEGNSLTLEQLLSKGTIDFYVMGTDPVLTKGLKLTPIFQEEMMLVISRQAEVLRHLQLPPNEPGVLQYIPPQLLERIPFYSATSSQGTYYLAHQVFDQFNIQPTISMEVINTSVAYRMAPQSGGFAFAPVTVFYEEEFSHDPIFCSLSDDIIFRTAGILSRGDGALDETAETFLKIALREIRKFARLNIPKFQVRHDIDFSDHALFNQ